MNFGQERYSWMEQDPYTGDKMPFYMTYPMQNTLFEETEYEKDCRRMQELYPRDARQIQSLVDRECDRMEYEGSMMYDRYPEPADAGNALPENIPGAESGSYRRGGTASGRGTLFSSDPSDADAGNVSKKMQALSVSEMVLGLV